MAKKKQQVVVSFRAKRTLRVKETGEIIPAGTVFPKSKYDELGRTMHQINVMIDLGHIELVEEVVEDAIEEDSTDGD